MESKKRKISQISHNDLHVYSPRSLYCQICGDRVYQFELCVRNYIYCSYDCYALLVLSSKHGFLHDLKKVKSEDNLYSSGIIFCMICGTEHSLKDRRWC